MSATVASAMPHITSDEKAELISAYRRLIDSRQTSLPNHLYSVVTHQPDISDEMIGQLIEVDGAHHPDVIEITLAQCSEYSGSDLDRANVRTLDSNYELVTAYEDYGAWGESRAWVVLGESPADATVAEWIEQLTDIADALDGLDDYPILSESDWSELEFELQDSSWSAWLEYDVRRELEKYAPDGIHDLYWEPGQSELIVIHDGYADLNEAMVREAYYEFEGNDWSCETANSATNHRHEDAVRHVAETLFGWSK